MKKYFIIVASLTLLLAFAQRTFAEGVDVTVGIDYQSGDYDLTYGDTYKVGIPAPKLVYTLKETYGNWSITGFYGDSGCNTISTNSLVSEYWSSTSSLPDLSYKARSRKYGIDLGYTFTFGQLTLTPTLGYHDTLMTSGYEYLYTSTYDVTARNLLSYEIKEIRLGAIAGYVLSPKIILSAGFGFSVRSHYYETQENTSTLGGLDTAITVNCDPGSQSSSSSDYMAALTYRFNPHFAAQVKYSYERGSMDTDGGTRIGFASNSYHCGVFSLGGSYSF
jgi:hypothetical protein